MKTVAYLRVSTGTQDLNTQKLAILEFARSDGIRIDEFVEKTVSSRRDRQRQELDSLMAGLTRSDRLVVSELSRLGRSLEQANDA